MTLTAQHPNASAPEHESSIPHEGDTSFEAHDSSNSSCASNPQHEEDAAQVSAPASTSEPTATPTPDNNEYDPSACDEFSSTVPKSDLGSQHFDSDDYEKSDEDLDLTNIAELPDIDAPLITAAKCERSIYYVPSVAKDEQAAPLTEKARNDIKSSGRLFRKPLVEYTSREIGLEGENLAFRYLERRGYTVLARNWRTKDAEADIVCRVDTPVEGECLEPGTIVLVEVKTRRTPSQEVMPEIAVDYKKQRKYRTIALLYLALHPSVENVRFDVIAINLTSDNSAKLRHLMGAYSWDE